MTHERDDSLTGSPQGWPSDNAPSHPPSARWSVPGFGEVHPSAPHGQLIAIILTVRDGSGGASDPLVAGTSGKKGLRSENGTCKFSWDTPATPVGYQSVITVVDGSQIVADSDQEWSGDMGCL